MKMANSQMSGKKSLASLPIDNSVFSEEAFEKYVLSNNQGVTYKEKNGVFVSMSGSPVGSGRTPCSLTG